jgi:hypothetical protein
MLRRTLPVCTRFLIYYFSETNLPFYYLDNLKDYKQQFELMLEGENQVDNCKQKLSLAEAKEAKLKKEYKKAFKREQPSEIQEVETQLKQATHASELAQEESNSILLPR